MGLNRLIRQGLILAAGRGQRMMPLTAALPKPMAPYRGSTLIADGIAKLVPRLDRIHVTVGYKAAMLAQHVIEHGVSSVFNTEGRSNAWWLRNTLLAHLDEPLVVLTCDNVVDLDFDLLEDSYRALGEPACMLVPVRPVPGLDGDFIFHDAHVVTRLSRTDPAEIYCSGIQVLNPARVNEVATGLGDDADFYATWHALIAQRMLAVSSVYPKTWFAVDTLEQLALLEERDRPGHQARRARRAVPGRR